MAEQSSKKKSGEAPSQEELKYTADLADAIKWWGKKHNITQEKIAAKINCHQTHISNLLNCVETHIRPDHQKEYVQVKHSLLTYTKACQICEAMGTSVGEVLYFYGRQSQLSAECTNMNGMTEENIYDSEPKKYERAPRIYDSHEKLINDVHHPSFKTWFGTYYTLFSSTSSKEDKYFFGTLKILEDSPDGACHVEFEFVSNKVKKKIKKYTGTLTLTSQAAYCTLEDSENEGEITYLLMHNPDLKTTIKVSCCLALVLTFSSRRGKRRPCCERMLISRFQLDENHENFELIKSQLLMNDKYIYITESKYKEFIDSITPESDEALRAFKENFPSIESLTCDTVQVERFAEIKESWIYDLLFLEGLEAWKVVFQLRNQSLSKRYMKINPDSEEIIYDLIKEEGG